MKDSNLPEHFQSIFHQLFEHATDLDCKLLLLDQILEIGDIKEIPLLEELENSENLALSNKAFKIRTSLLNKLGRPPSKKKTRLPMNLCFLYDEFDIKPAKLKGLDMDFEVSLEIFETEQENQ
ncbi:hypothetical protein DKG77_12030 [Flagellimonas aquimarina]|uniref:Uncharacterized protein n=1 Tax=Flagellimonas aquimarina TaxID=2201895 RepID=A0A316L1W3_9FLAO|nr:hypothetical protein [Allomuricauda koreensis]PWL38949.1 hypothetical protein DKG77_12030 [Allomuricauda koreensis]